MSVYLFFISFVSLYSLSLHYLDASSIIVGSDSPAEGGEWSCSCMVCVGCIYVNDQLAIYVRSVCCVEYRERDEDMCVCVHNAPMYIYTHRGSRPGLDPARVPR